MRDFARLMSEIDKRRRVTLKKMLPDFGAAARGGRMVSPHLILHCNKNVSRDGASDADASLARPCW
jgi:hypothetical protein